MDYSMPDFLVLHHLPEFAQTHVHRADDAIESMMMSSFDLWLRKWKWKLLSCVWLFETSWTVHEILQARIVEWVAFPFSRGSSQPRDQTQISRTAGGFFTSWATREAPLIKNHFLIFVLFTIWRGWECAKTASLGSLCLNSSFGLFSFAFYYKQQKEA